MTNLLNREAAYLTRLLKETVEYLHINGLKRLLTQTYGVEYMGMRHQATVLILQLRQMYCRCRHSETLGPCEINGKKERRNLLILNFYRVFPSS